MNMREEKEEEEEASASNGSIAGRWIPWYGGFKLYETPASCFFSLEFGLVELRQGRHSRAAGRSRQFSGAASYAANATCCLLSDLLQVHTCYSIFVSFFWRNCYFSCSSPTPMR